MCGIRGMAGEFGPAAWLHAAIRSTSSSVKPAIPRRSGAGKHEWLADVDRTHPQRQRGHAHEATFVPGL